MPEAKKKQTFGSLNGPWLSSFKAQIAILNPIIMAVMAWLCVQVYQINHSRFTGKDGKDLDARVRANEVTIGSLPTQAWFESRIDRLEDSVNTSVQEIEAHIDRHIENHGS